ncbi:amidohydrolase [Subtercola boreus]|uniref:Amidohydrolase n=1 Tax=Subtercola boreus TaxID=120213 RepID=A0A3E0VB10_9MICO|nr:amidohydrolase [Subtercola boreus]RFA06921.1 amidohydrolase [Subtercola boreus]
MSAVLFYGGTIRLDSTTDTADELLVVDGVVAEAGTHVPAEAVTIDLEGGLLLPAFGDGHVHPLLAGRELAGPQLRDAASVNEIVRRVADWSENSWQPWLIGGSYDATIVDGGLFDARWLDAADRDRPIVLHSWDYHTVWVNTAALEAAGITSATADPASGRIARRPDGSPLGTLIERPAIDLVLGRAPQPRIEDDVESIVWASERLAERGIAWAQEAWTELDQIPAWIAAGRSERLSVDFDLALRADPGLWPGQLGAIVAAARSFDDVEGLTARTIKFFVDGIIETHTAQMLECYHDASHRGIANWPPERLVDAVVECDRAGFDVHLHAIGDAAVRSAIDAAEAIRESLRRGRRLTIAHAQVIDPEDLARLASLDVTICFQPQWAALDDVMAKLTLPRLGAERELQYRIRSALQAGARISFGSDWPVAAPDVISGIQTAVTRQNAEGQPSEGWYPAERISVHHALDAATAGVAYQAGDEKTRGALGAGFRADLVWLDRDIREVAPERITEARVRGTWRRGERTYSAPE